MDLTVDPTLFSGNEPPSSCSSVQYMLMTQLKPLHNFQRAMPHMQGTSVSLKSGWSGLRHAINKLSGCIKHVQRLNRSGETVKDQI
ncbi:hypothetical protein O181_007583 [Austropuccinia psidii MF-1]|uniref:Uncharacterized protein n=1 Tax=Austropuccinia psidii MF-1 TaxID=1389203 RepID=A0A9Q3BMH2_9BASI|nr:hypothetical protein [Austropuccinia psidii MF-1]